MLTFAQRVKLGILTYFKSSWGLFLALAVIQLIPIWSVSYFVTQDGPTHVESAVVLKNLLFSESSIFHSFFELNLGVSNLFDHFVLAGLSYFFSAMITEKIFISFMIIFFALCFRYFVLSINSKAKVMSCLGFCFTYSWFLHMGFYNFVFSMGMALLSIGFWLRSKGGVRSYAYLSILGLLSVLMHPVSLPVITVAIMSLIIGGRTGEKFSFQSKINDLANCLMAMIPAASVIYFFSTQNNSSMNWSMSKEYLFKYFFFNSSLQSFTSVDPKVLFAMSIVLWFAVVYTLYKQLLEKRFLAQGSLLLCASLLLVLYVIAPYQYGAGLFINQRIALFPIFFLCAWLVKTHWHSGVIRGCMALFLIVGSLRPLLALPKYHLIDEQVKEFMAAAPEVKTGSSYLMVSGQSFVLDGDSKMKSLFQPFLHISSLYASERNLVNLANYEASKSYFPIRYKSSVNPYRYLGSVESMMPAIFLSSYEARVGMTVDYVLGWKMNDFNRYRRTQSLLRDLANDFDLVYDSGSTRLYRRGGRPVFDISKFLK